MHLISIDDLSVADIEGIFQLSDGFLEVASRPIKKVPTLRGRTQINMFFEPSTRTQASFEIAGKRLSADVINLDINRSSTAKGESLLDTIDNLCAMHANLFVVRHASSGAPYLIAEHLQRIGRDDVHVVNAGDGRHAHPTQGLLDIMTMRQRLGDLRGRLRDVGDRGAHAARRDRLDPHVRRGHHCASARWQFCNRRPARADQPVRRRQLAGAHPHRNGHHRYPRNRA